MSFQFWVPAVDQLASLLPPLMCFAVLKALRLDGWRFIERAQRVKRVAGDEAAPARPLARYEQ